MLVWLSRSMHEYPVLEWCQLIWGIDTYKIRKGSECTNLVEPICSGIMISEYVSWFISKLHVSVFVESRLLLSGQKVIVWWCSYRLTIDYYQKILVCTRSSCHYVCLVVCITIVPIAILSDDTIPPWKWCDVTMYSNKDLERILDVVYNTMFYTKRIWIWSFNAPCLLSSSLMKEYQVTFLL